MPSPFVTRSASPFTEHSEPRRYMRRPAFRQMVVGDSRDSRGESVVIQHRFQAFIHAAARTRAPVDGQAILLIKVARLTLGCPATLVAFRPK